MMKVQEYLNYQTLEGGSPDAALGMLHEVHGIKVKKYDDRVVLNYNQIESIKTSAIPMECRGLILSYPDFEVMARGFDRFFNHGEAPEFSEQVDFSRAVVYEKADGSYISVYHDGNKWCIATRGTAFAETENYSGRTFNDMVAEAFVRDLNDTLDEVDLNEYVTLIFEFTSPQNRVVTRYEKPEMVLLAARNRISGEYFNFKDVELFFREVRLQFKFRVAKTFDISTADAALEAARELKGLQEGYVAFDPVSQARVKIKSPTYVAVHHIKGEGLTPKRMASLVTCGEVEEYLTYFPEDIEQIEPYVDELGIMMDLADLTFEQTKHIESQKDFAMEVKDMVQAPIMFMARKNKSSPSHEFNLQQDTMKVRMLLKYMNEGENKYAWI